ncbi:hypothetical protein B9J87_04395 [Vibrio sp. V19_P1S1T109]|uniref:DUF3833 domain-containing protein n=1 Tax=Vibrio TaxID=662 RepID=UPI0002F262CC|nr:MULTISPECIES: DUF3833 domain-containing protein [Vibrio]OEE78348.1 hypothetical protein A1QQ_11840 [Vibrio ordalii FF-167]OXX74050.1 hypothetical protein B9J87_04395 [Vibrio sp. V19_P1S1T109]
MKAIARRSYLLLLLWLVGCSADLTQYQSTQPKFDLFEYFSGRTLAWGMVQDYTGMQTRRFEVAIDGTVEGNKLTLVEDFNFDDGEKSQRVWVIERFADGKYIGQADDVLGQAQGEEVGNALRWQYDFSLPYGDSTLTVTFDDWLYRQDEKRVFNLTKIKKFGIEVGKLTLFFEKQ